MKEFEHEALSQTELMPLVYTAMSKHCFYYRMHISKYVLERKRVPLNPFMIFDYFLLDAVDRNLVRQGNMSIVQRCDEVWVFGPISNGVLAEIKIAQASRKPVKYFQIQKPHAIIEISKEAAEMESDVEAFRSEL